VSVGPLELSSLNSPYVVLDFVSCLSSLKLLLLLEGTVNFEGAVQANYQGDRNALREYKGSIKNKVPSRH